MPALAPVPHVLVAEDDADLLDTVQEALEEEGYGVTPTASLPASLRALEDHLFQFILTDLFSQPGQSHPLQSIQHLIAQAEPIPVGVMTAWPIRENDPDRANLAFLLPKPFDLDDLQRKLHAHLHPTISRPLQHQVVEAFFAALNAQDWQRLARLCTPNVRVAPVSAPAVASFSSRQGLSSFQLAMERRFRRLPGYTIEGVQVFRRQMGVAARYLASWQDSDDVEHCAAGSLHFRFQGERIAQIEGAF